jgi:type I restriction enzyme S subunit
LQEYKTRLISDVVTGKLDVRRVTVPKYETASETANDVSEDSEETEEDDNADE